MSIQVPLASAIYLPECLREAITAYQELCSVRVVSEKPAGYSIEISRFEDAIDEEQLAHEFLNYLLDLSLEKHLSEFQERDETDRVSTT